MRMQLLRDWLGFFRERKKYWLLPVIIVLVLLGFLIFSLSGTVIAPFIYTLF
jgi:hypothetical protein